MLNTTVINYRLVLTLVISILFGCAYVIILPILGEHTTMLMALPLAGLFFLMMVAQPKMTFVLIFMTRPFLDNLLNLTKVSAGGQDVGFGAILNLLVIVLVVFLFFYEGGFPRRNPVVRGWVIFLLVMLFAAVESPYLGRAVRLYANDLSFFAMFLAPFFLIKRREDFTFWLKAFAWSFVVPIIYANVHWIQGGQYYPDAGMRVRGSFSHPNILAFYLCLGITYYFYLLKSKILTIRSWTWGGMVVLMVNMVLLLLATKTRNAWIACFFTFFIYGLLKDHRTLMILLMMIPLTLLVPSVRDRVVTVFDQKSSLNYHGVNSFEWRLQMWTSSLPMISQRPVQGYGLTSFKEMSSVFSEDRNAMGAHNVYVETLFESGIVGLVAFLVLFYKPFKFFWEQMRRSKDHAAAIVWSIAVAYILSYLLVCIADNLSYYLVLNWYVWFFIGLLMVSQRFQKSTTEIETRQ